MNQTQIIARNVLSIIVSQVIGNGLLFLTTIVVARSLGREIFGQFSFVLAFVLMFQMLADPGIYTVMVRMIAVNKEKKAEIFGSVKGLIWLLSICVYLLLIAVAFMMDLSATIRIAILVQGLATLATIHALGYTNIFRAMEAMHLHGCIFVLHKVILIAIIGLAILLNGGVIALTACYLSANLVLWFTQRTVVNRLFFRAKLRFACITWKGFLLQGIPIGVSMIIRQVSWQVDIIILTMLTNAPTVGIFAAAYKIIQALTVLPSATAIPLYPSYSRLGSESPGELLSAFERGLVHMMLLSAPLVIVLHSLAVPLISLLFGESYVQSGEALRIMSIVLLFLFPTTHFIYVFSALKKQVFMTAVSIMSLSVNIVLDLLLIPSFGVLGACWGTLFGEATFFCIGIIFLSRLDSSFSVSRSGGRLLLLAVGLIAAESFLSSLWNLPASGEAFCLLLLYGILVWFLKLVNYAEVRRIGENLFMSRNSVANSTEIHSGNEVDPL